MTDEPDDKVKRLPVRFKGQPPSDRVLLHLCEVPKADRCSHILTSYLVDPAAAEVECGRCGAKLNAMWVLGVLASEDRRFADARARYQDEMRRLNERMRTKCDHCGQMTRIRRR